MKKVLVVLVVVLLGLAAFVASRPAAYHVERSATIPAPPESLYARIVDLHHWESWSPWAGIDPAMKADYSGAGSGLGASYHWVGNAKVGEGRMTITDAQAPGRVALRLEFIKPFASVCTTTFHLVPDAAGTHVTWAMDGTNNFIGKAMCLVMNMDKVVGPDFERGLTRLAREAGAAPAAPAADSTAGRAAKT